MISQTMNTGHPKSAAASNLLGDALKDSRQHFRQMLASMDRLVESGRKEEARKHLPKLEAMSQELRRLLNPRDVVDRKLRGQIDRDLQRMQKSCRKGWSGAVGKSILALVIGSVVGLAALVAVLYFVFF